MPNRDQGFGRQGGFVGLIDKECREAQPGLQPKPPRRSTAAREQIFLVVADPFVSGYMKPPAWECVKTLSIPTVLDR